MASNPQLCLGEKLCQALPVWFAFIGCATVSALSGRGKKDCMEHFEVLSTYSGYI